jgi:hypothetical protein
MSIIVLLSVTLGYLVSPYWLLLTALVGLNLLQSALTGFCPLAVILRNATEITSPPDLPYRPSSVLR